MTCNVLGKREKGLLSWEVGVVFSLFRPLGLCLCLPPLFWALEGWSPWTTSSTLACPLISIRSQPWEALTGNPSVERENGEDIYSLGILSSWSEVGRGSQVTPHSPLTAPVLTEAWERPPHFALLVLGSGSLCCSSLVAAFSLPCYSSLPILLQTCDLISSLQLLFRMSQQFSARPLTDKGGLYPMSGCDAVYGRCRETEWL